MIVQKYLRDVRNGGGSKITSRPSFEYISFVLDVKLLGDTNMITSAAY